MEANAVIFLVLNHLCRMVTFYIVDATTIKRIFLYWFGTNLSFLNISKYEQWSLKLFHGGGFSGTSRWNGESKWRNYGGICQCSPTVVFKNLRISANSFGSPSLMSNIKSYQNSNCSQLLHQIASLTFTHFQWRIYSNEEFYHWRFFHRIEFEGKNSFYVVLIILAVASIWII